jgi:hypothetical protein
MFALFKLLRLRWQEWCLDRACRAIKGEEARENWYAENQWEINAIAEGIGEIETNRLVRQARRFNVPIPEKDWLKWGKSNSTGHLYLLPDAVIELHNAIRDAKLKSTTVRTQVWFWRIGILAAAVSALVGLNTLLKTTEAKRTTPASTAPSNQTTSESDELPPETPGSRPPKANQNPVFQQTPGAGSAAVNGNGNTVNTNSAPLSGAAGDNK